MAGKGLSGVPLFHFCGDPPGRSPGVFHAAAFVFVLFLNGFLDRGGTGLQGEGYEVGHGHPAPLGPGAMLGQNLFATETNAIPGNMFDNFLIQPIHLP